MCDCDPGQAMNVPQGQNANSEQPPPGWFLRTACRFRLNHHNASHWTIAGLTFLLALFAFFAWRESIATTGALQAQLDVLRVQQRPYVSLYTSS